MCEDVATIFRNLMRVVQKMRQSRLVIVAITTFLLCACGGKAAALPLAEVEMQAKNQVDVGEVETSEKDVEEGYPALILGDPQLQASDPSAFTRASGRVQLLEFFAYWCPNCKRLAPSIHGLEEIYSARMNFIYLDIDNPINQAQMDAFGFYYQPFIILLDPNGIVLRSWVGGGIDPLELQEGIESALRMIG